VDGHNNGGNNGGYSSMSVTDKATANVDKPLPEINCPIKIKCCPYNELKTLAWILQNLEGIPRLVQNKIGIAL